jgi:uncharacterized pyridoxal phosphate-dependent enzyme
MSSSDGSSKVTRRSFLRSQAALAAVAATPLAGAASARAATAAAATGENYYTKLGLRTFINAAGTKTVLTAACMPEPVQAAVAEAAKHWVYLEDLQQTAGEYIAKRLKNEGCCITCGADSAITLVTAACVMAANNCKPADIPHLIGTEQYPKNEVIVQQHYDYEQALYLAGVKLVLVRSLDEYKKAFGPNTVMAHYVDAAVVAKSSEELNTQDTSAGFSAGISREDWIAVAHEHGIPCNLDAAADCLPIERLWKYTQMGFDTVCFSGGKCIRGPQNAGLLLGKKKYTDLAHRNSCPNDSSIGRGMKVAKEQLVGMVAAVDWLLSQGDEGLDKTCRDRAAVITNMVNDIPSVKTSIIVAPLSNHVPHLIIDFDPAVIGASAQELKARLATGTPAIEINPQTGSTTPNQDLPAMPNALVIYVYLLRPGDETIVAQQIRQVLKNPKSVGTDDPGVLPRRVWALE